MNLVALVLAFLCPLSVLDARVDYSKRAVNVLERHRPYE